MSFQSEIWTIAEVIAWVWYRNPEKVDEISPYTESQLRSWETAARWYEHSKDDTARRELRDLLEARKLVGTGRFCREAELKEIPASDWRLFLWEFPNLVERGSQLSWRSIQFVKNDVLELWPDPRHGTTLAEQIATQDVDPFASPHWNLIQTLAWVFRGNKDDVRRAANPGPDGSHYWYEFFFWDELDEHEGEADGNEDDGGFFESPLTAMAAILMEAECGNLLVQGRMDDKGRHEPIPPIEFSSLAIRLQEPPVLGPRDTTKIGAPVWADVLFRSEEILNRWPENAGKAERRKFGGQTFVTFARLSSAWADAQETVPALTVDEIYRILWNAIWDDVFGGKIIKVDLHNGRENGIAQYNGKDAPYNRGDLALSFEMIVRECGHVSSDRPITFEDCMKVNPRLLIWEMNRVLAARHDQFGIYLDDFIECWNKSGEKLPEFLREGGPPSSLSTVKPGTPKSVAPPSSSSHGAGRKPTFDREDRERIKDLYPEGKPHMVTWESIRADLKEKLGKDASERTISETFREIQASNME